VQEVTFKGAGGVTLIAWYLPARRGKPTVLYFTGNSGNASYRAGKIAAMAADGYGVFMLN
jgi:cephalosporin-C deacetylase-like acetyl esterase